MRARYYVVGVTGLRIKPGTDIRAAGGKLATSYSVLDRDYCHNEVFRVSPTSGNGPDERRKQIADARCAELNAEERAWLRS